MNRFFRNFVPLAASALAAFLFSAAPAAALEPATVTIDSVSSTDTVRGLDISGTAATSVIISTGPLFRQVCVQNVDATYYLACSENALVSTTLSSNAVGVIIPAAPTTSTPAQPTCFSVSAGTHFYCRNSSGSTTSRAVIIRGR